MLVHEPITLVHAWAWLASLAIFGIWTTPRDWVDGEFVSAALMNTFVRDEFNLLKTSINDNGTLKFMQNLGHIGPFTIGADQNDYNPTGFSTCFSLSVEPTGADRSITGFLAPAAAALRWLKNVSASRSLKLPTESGSSAPGNKIDCYTDGGSVTGATLLPSESCWLYYTPTRGVWDIVASSG